MSKAGLVLRSPIITSQNQIDTQTSIELRSDEPHARIYFTIDGTQPRRGNNSTYLYTGGFQLNPGRHTLKSITVTGDGLRESNVTTKYIDVDDDGFNIERPFSNISGTSKENSQYMRECYQPPPTPRYEEDNYWDQKTKLLSPGNGNWKKTLEHVFLNIYNFVKGEYELREVFGWKQFGRIETARVVDKGGCYQVITTFKKPFYDQTPYEEPPLSIRKPKRRPKKRMPISSDDEKSSRVRREEPKHEEEKRKPRIYTDEIEQQGTLVPFSDFDVNQDCESLRKAMKSSGTDESVLIEILGNRIAAQRVEIRNTYNKKFDRDFEDDLKRDIETKNFRKILMNLFHSQVEFDCHQLHRAIQGLNGDEEILVEILASRSNRRLEKINNIYPKMFDRSLEEDIVSNTAGHLKKILIVLIQGQRPESNEIREDDVEKDAKRLYEAGENKWGTEKSIFIQILSNRSNAQLKAIFEAYGKLSKKNIEADIKSETSGNLCKGLLTIVRIMRHRPGFFAYQLKKALESVNTNENELNRVIISRCEVDMVQIKEQYEKLMKRSLEDHIRSDTNGDYREILLELIKDPSKRKTKTRHTSSRDSSPRPERKKREIVEEPEIYREEIIQKGTMIAAKNFDANRDADALRKAMKGSGTDEQTLINILGNRDTTQRLAIKTAFKNKHNRDLTADLKSETSGHFAKLFERLMMDPVELDCFELKAAVKGIGTDENGLIEILASRSNKRIRDINKKYQEMYKTSLDKDVRSDTSGDFRHLLAALMQGGRPETIEVNVEQAKRDAKSLMDAGSEKFKTDQARFNVLYSDRSDAQLKAIFNEFDKLNGKPIEEVVKKETKSDHQAAILAIIKCIQSRPHFFAERLRNAIKGVGTKESVLNRIIITRSEVDLVQIKEAYKNLFSRELERDVASDTSGDYKKLLLELLKDPSQRKF